MTAGRLASGLMIAAPRSGSGKTVITVGLQRALTRRGLVVRGAKSGPDYIDPAFHAAATGSPAVNLDGFAMPDEMIAGLAAQAAAHADLIIAEGAMGLFDGAAGARSGACADIARLLGWPVVLIVDGTGAAQSVAALAHGCATFPGAPRITGVIVNRVASPRHARLIEAGFARLDLPLLGLLPVDARLDLPSRHLGLVQAVETEATRIEAIADAIAEHCDLEAIRKSAAPTGNAPTPAPTIRLPGQRMAIARDAAFAFLYPHLLDGWRRAGAEIRFFSPLADEPPPDDCTACWLPGGYPELHAPQLAASHCFLEGLRRFAETRPVHGECGGYMVLGRTLEDAGGKVHAMAGLLPVATSFARRRLHLGYRRATWRGDTAFAKAGETHLGHEFHYATIVADDGLALADMADGGNAPLPAAGHRQGNVTGTFFHLIA